MKDRSTQMQPSPSHSPSASEASSRNANLAVGGTCGPGAGQAAKARPYRPGAFLMVTDVIRACPDRYFITLTTRRRYDEITLSREVSKTMHRVNRALFGTAYIRRKRLWLATYAVRERTSDQGLHSHLLVGAPAGSLMVKANPCRIPVSDLILKTWTSLDDPGLRSAKGQDAREITDFDGALGYVTKTVHSLEDIDVIDILNTTFPETP